MSLLGPIKTMFLTTGLRRGILERPVGLSQVRNYAARKGTREKKKKQKVKVEEKKVGFIPHNLRKKENLSDRPQRKFDDSWKQLPIDNVYPHKFYRWPTYSFIEAVQCHKETHHPEMYNKPNAYLHVTIELNMEGEKKTRFLENFSRIVAIPHKFDMQEERTIMAFSKTPELQEAARQMGAQLVGGMELIKEIQNGAVSLQDFQYVVAHPNILPELVVLRGLMKRKFPNVKTGTLDANLVEACKKLLYGINYTATKDEYEKDFGIIESQIGMLNMDAEQLEGNFAALIKDIDQQKPKRAGTFISRCLLWSPPSREKLRVDLAPFVGAVQNSAQDDEQVEEKQAVAAS